MLGLGSMLGLPESSSDPGQQGRAGGCELVKLLVHFWERKNIQQPFMSLEIYSKVDIIYSGNCMLNCIPDTRLYLVVD